MNRRYRHSIASFILVLIVVVLGASAWAQTAAPAKTAPVKPASTKQAPAAGSSAGKHDVSETDLRAIKRPPLPPFHPQLPKRIQLSNGMVIFLQEDHELPLIEVDTIVRGGSKEEPANKVGLASIFGSTWRTGGTKTRTGDQLDDILEARAARVEAFSDLNSTGVTLSCLKGDFDFVFDVFNDVLKNPEFRQEKIDLAKDSIRTGIARRNDNLGQIAGRESTILGYGKDSPYARLAEYATVAAVTRQDLLDWHARHLYPNNIIMGISGDFDSAAMEAKLRKAYESWAKGPDYKAPAGEIAPAKPGVYLVEKNDVNQSEVRMVAPGIRKDNPDYYAVEAMNQLFGGSFASRLFSRLRTKEGLAYSVGGGVGAPLGNPGLTRLSIGTKSGTTAKAIEGLYREIDAMHTEAVTPAELQKAKDAILNSFIFEYDSKDKVMRARLSYEFHGYPLDFLEQFQKKIEAVTVADVDRVAKKYLDKSKVALLVVGNSAEFDKPMSTFGPVTNVDITIPTGDASAKPAAKAGSNPEGKALLAKVVEGMGGADKVKSIRALRRKISLSTEGGDLENEETDVVPDKIHSHMKAPMGEMVLVTASESFVTMQGNVIPMPGSNRDEMQNSLHREAWLIAQHADDPAYTFSAQGTEKAGDVQAAVLDVSGGGIQVRWLIDPKSGHILRSQFQASSRMGPATQVIDYSEWKAVDGITVPFHAEVTTNGEHSATVVIQSCEFNPTIDPKLFDKPQK